MAVTELRISLAPLPGCLPTDVVDSALRAAAGNAAGLRDVRLEPVGSALVLTLAFESPVDVQVRPAPQYQPDCAGCHASNFRSGPHDKTLQGTKYTVSELRNCSGACHVYTNATLTTISRTRNGPEHRVTSSEF